MIAFQALTLMHHHGGDDWAAMTESEHTSADHDPERAWLKGARIFRCNECDNEIAVATEPPGLPADHPHPAI